MNIVNRIDAAHAAALRKVRQEAYRAGLRDGYTSRVLDEDSARQQRENQGRALTDACGYFVGPISVEACGDPEDWDVVVTFGADTFKLRRSDAIAVEIDAQTAIYDGPEPPEPDLDAARKALIEEEKELS